MRQEYSQDFLQGILDSYDSFSSIQEARLFTSGFENSNFYVRTESGEYVIKIFEGEKIGEAQVAFELEVMETSYLSGVKTPRVYRTKESLLYTIHLSKIAMVMDYVSGKNMDGEIFSDTLIYQLGYQLGKMDTALAIFSDGTLTRQHYEFDLKNLLESKQYLRLLLPNLNADVYTDVLDIFEHRKSEFDTLPGGLIHNDAAAHNIIVNNDAIACIIDFSDMAFSPYIQNIAVTVAQTVLSENWNQKQIRDLIQGYVSQRTLSSFELSFLYDLVRARYVEIVLAFCDWNNRFGEDGARTEYIIKADSYLRKVTEIGEENFNASFSII